jgi:hypothetical protein
VAEAVICTPADAAEASSEPVNVFHRWGALALAKHDGDAQLAMALAEHIDEELLTLTRQKTLQQQPCTYADKEALVRGLLAAPGKAQAMREAADDASEGAAADPRKQ